MLGSIGKVLVVVYVKLFKGVLHKTKSICFSVAHSKIDGAGAASVVQLLQGRLEGL